MVGYKSLIDSWSASSYYRVVAWMEYVAKGNNKMVINEILCQRKDQGAHLALQCSIEVSVVRIKYSAVIKKRHILQIGRDTDEIFTDMYSGLFSMKNSREKKRQLLKICYFLFYSWIIIVQTAVIWIITNFNYNIKLRSCKTLYSV